MPNKMELQATQQTIKFLEALLRASVDGIVITDATQSIILVNEAFCGIFDVSWQDVIETSLFVWLEQFDADAPYQWSKMQNAIHSEGSCSGVEFQRTTQAGVRHFEVNASFLEQIAIEEEGVTICIWRDVTDRKLAEEQLKRQKEELSEFAHSMTHDLNNWLFSIRSYADMLQTKYDPSDAEKIGYLAENMGDLLRHSIALADAGLVIEKTDDIDLAELVQATAAVIVPDNVNFKQDKFPKVTGDREKLLQVFQNLLLNAVYHGKPSEIQISQQDVFNGMNLLITNDGIPIPPEHRSKIFHQRFSTKKGGGLGLAIAKKLVEAHGWHIHLEDAPKTTFCIFIPKIDDS